MPIFAAFFGALFSALGSFLVRLFIGRIALRVAGVVALTALGAGLVSAFNGWISPMVHQMFSTQYGQVLGLAFPPIAGTVLTVYFLAFSAVLTYKLQARAVTLTSGL